MTQRHADRLFDNATCREWWTLRFYLNVRLPALWGAVEAQLFARDLERKRVVARHWIALRKWKRRVRA